MNGYVITDANKKLWVCKDHNNYTLSTDPNKAFIFDSKITANAAYNNSLSKVIKSKGVTVKAIQLQIADDEMPKEEKPKAVVEQTQPEVDSSKYIVSVLSEAVAKLNCRHLALTEELSKYDRQRTDVEHYIEFNTGKLNACDGYRAYKLLQDVLVSRRKVKDELSIIKTALDRIAAPEELALIDARVEALESRQYTPREFKHLFEQK